MGDATSHYDQTYARKYIERTLFSPYTVYKNQRIAAIAAELGVNNVTDIGGNVSGLIKTEGSLRTQLEECAISYTGVDLSPSYFQPAFARSLGVPRERTYEDAHGVVGSLLNLPFASSSQELVVCADVIEHVPDPHRGSREVARVLTEKGHAIIIVPSMYKLDTLNLPKIEMLRKSSHESKMTIEEWIRLFEEEGLEVSMKLSRPLGIASGLSYLVWLQEQYVPRRESLEGEDVKSEESKEHAKVKAFLALHDDVLDGYFSQATQRTELEAALLDGCLDEVFALIATAVAKTLSHKEQAKEVMATLMAWTKLQFSDEDRYLIRQFFSTSKEKRLFIGNSVLLVLSKKKE